jgi:hypothetical protein
VKDILTAVKIALLAGGYQARGVPEHDSPKGMMEEILRLLEQENLSPSIGRDIEELAYAFAQFSDNVRAAERKGMPISQVHGDPIPDAK